MISNPDIRNSLGGILKNPDVQHGVGTVLLSNEKVQGSLESLSLQPSDIQNVLQNPIVGQVLGIQGNDGTANEGEQDQASIALNILKQIDLDKILKTTSREDIADLSKAAEENPNAMKDILGLDKNLDPEVVKLVAGLINTTIGKSVFLLL